MSNMGRPCKLQDQEVLENLMDVKMIEGLSWKELAEFYEETYGESIHPDTIRRALLRDAPTLLMPVRANKKVKQAIEDVWDQVDIMRLVMFAVNARFTEWSMLYERTLNFRLEDKELTPEHVADQDRMDMLWNDIIGFFLRAMNIMKDLKVADVATSDLEIFIRANGLSGETSARSSSSSGNLTPDSVRNIITEIGETTQKMLEGVHERHRKEGRGFYRQIDEKDEGEYDLLEIDS